MPQTLIKPNKKGQLLFNQLDSISEEIWCEYLFNRDLLVKEIQPEQRQALINGAIRCGKELAESVIGQYGNLDAIELADNLCKIKHADSQNVHKQIFLATFTEPNEIKIYDEPIEKLMGLNIPSFDHDTIYRIVLGHELFHYFESKNPDLYTRTKKIELWHFLGYHHRSTVRATSEIAAMVFSWKLNLLNFSPLILDILMLHCYNAKAVIDVRRELVTISENEDKKILG